MPGDRAEPKRYSATTTRRAQTRVLRLVFGYLSFMSPKALDQLRTDGNGLMTLREILEHVKAAMNLKVKR